MTQHIVLSLPVTVNAIRLDGKKLTKSIFDQFRRSPFFRSAYFENLALTVSQINLPILARHNFQIKEQHHKLHFLYAMDGEIFVDDIDPEHNFVVDDLKNIKKKIQVLENQLKAAEEVLSGAEVDGRFWLRLTQGILFEKYSAFHSYRSIFEGDSTEIECLKSALKSEKSISQEDFNLILKNKNLTDIFRLNVKEKSDRILRALPNEITNHSVEHKSLKAKYELVMDRIRTVPQIVIGV